MDILDISPRRCQLALWRNGCDVLGNEHFDRCKHLPKLVTASANYIDSIIYYRPSWYACSRGWHIGRAHRLVRGGGDLWFYAHRILPKMACISSVWGRESVKFLTVSGPPPFVLCAPFLLMIHSNRNNGKDDMRRILPRVINPLLCRTHLGFCAKRAPGIEYFG